ncbi:hypothetical protein E3V08_05025 [Candidatus Atribacteria bacterium MT.SAG.1]|nr:hypothetical protein E3V08_05025 [Candidatus Atribacteria bacterium MT.SAG.1]
MKKFIITILIFLIGVIAGYLIFSVQNPDFENLSPEQMYQKVIKERDYAISQAVARGDFRCCINPPCTMCYMEANQWNNFTPGTCACDDLIAQGKEPCPQCKTGLCEGLDSTCNLKSLDD